MKKKRKGPKKDLVANLPVSVEKGRKMTKKKRVRNRKIGLKTVNKGEKQFELINHVNDDEVYSNIMDSGQNNENIPVRDKDDKLTYKHVEESSSNSYALKDVSNTYNSSSNNITKGESKTSLPFNHCNKLEDKNNKNNIDNLYEQPLREDLWEEEKTDDEFEFIMEQELIKEQIKRNSELCCKDDYINFLVEGSNSIADHEDIENLILRAIKSNRKLAEMCVILEAALVKKLDKIKKEVQLLRGQLSTLVEEGDSIISRGFYSQYGAPYFKDASGFYCPRNQDFNDKLSKNQFVGYLYMQSDHTADITALSHAIREYFIDNYIKKSNLADLKKSFSEVDNLVQQEVLKKELSFIYNKISYMKAVDLKYLVKDISDSDIDWMKIASKEPLDVLSPGECLRYWNLILSPQVNRGMWSQQEKKELKKLAMQYNYQSWDKITELLNTKRTGYQCFIQFKRYFGMVDFNRGRWSKKEDVQLSYLVSISEQGGVIGWAKVLCHLEDRTMAQALNRWYRLDPGLKKGKFTDEEDIILVNAVEQFGLDFQKVASVFPNRSAIQLRERYFAKRDMKVNKCGEWSLAEDKLLMDMIAVHGEKKWSKIAQNFPSRNRIQIRHRYKCIKLNLLKDPEFKLENLNRFKRNTHVNAKNKRDDEAISKSTAIDIISKTIEEGKIFYNKRRILKRTGRLKERG